MSKNRFSQRRDFLKSASILTLAPAIPMIPGLARASDSQIVVGTWGGDYQRLLQEYIAPIVAKDSISVVYDVGNATARTTKLKAERNARRASMDVAMLGDLDMYDASTAGVLEPTTEAAIPNLANVIDSFKTPYSIPHIFSAMVLVYNTEHFPTAPQSFNELLDPKYKGRVGFSDILYNFNTLFAGLAEGGKGNSFEPGWKFLLKLKENQPRVYPSNEAVAAAFKSGEIWVAPMWKARALQWRDAGLPLAFAIPQEGAIPVTFESAIPSNSRNKDNAFKYLNALLDPSGQVHFAQAMGYAPTIRNANLPPELQARVGFTEAELARIYPYDLKALASQRAASLDFWNKEFKTGL